MREKAAADRAGLVAVGITPACAGKSQSPRGLRPHSGDHPRVCGEKTLMRLVLFAVLGSPPRMRGKDGVNDSAQAVTGITPACAGKRAASAREAYFIWDHPRVCGEKSCMRKPTAWVMGSPPRMRGKVNGGTQLLARHRITPAYAGKRLWPSSCDTRGWDHPRVCGEKMCCTAIAFRSSGLPPRVRGKGRSAQLRGGQGGITPAYAGKS